MSWLRLLELAKALAGGAWKLAKRVPWQAWAVVALVLAIAWFGHWREQRGHDGGVLEERGRWEAAQRKANQDAQRANARRAQTDTRINTASDQRAAQASADTRAETGKIVERIVHDTRTIQLPADLDRPMPDGVRDALGAARDAANAAGRPLVQKGPDAGH